jgi:hypothetical protein
MCVSCIPKPAAFLVITRGKGKKEEEDGGTLDKKKK